MRGRILTIAIILALFASNYAQGQGQGYWKRWRYNIVFGIGATNFLGELGGADMIGTDFLRDFEIRATRPVGQMGLRYYMLEWLSVRGGFTIGILRGDDSRTGRNGYVTDDMARIRLNRNLHFRSVVAELDVYIEWLVFTTGRQFTYKTGHTRQLLFKGLSAAVFTGITGLYFNPKARGPDGRWHSLQPMSTEGQGIIPTREKYSRFTLALPMGFYINYKLNEDWLIGLEYSWRYTMTDYMDDVSTTYIDKEYIRRERGDLAAYMSDPNIGIYDHEVYTWDPGNQSWKSLGWMKATGASQQRGDPRDDDSYMFAMLTLTRKLKTTRKGMPKFGMFE
jgi:hypothetical protein